MKSSKKTTKTDLKLAKLSSLGITVENRVPSRVSIHEHNESYLKTKHEKLHHRIEQSTEDDKIQKIETEIKFLIPKEKVLQLRNKIASLSGIAREGRKYEKTTMLDDKKSTMRKRDARLRIREIKDQKDSESSRIEFSYKKRIGTTKGIKKEEEIETAFSADADTFFKILNKMGYRVVSSYERYRETYMADTSKITLDTFPFGYILEIEDGEVEISKLCDVLGLDKKNSYLLSCDDAYYDLCKKQGIKPKDHILFDDKEMPSIC